MLYFHLVWSSPLPPQNPNANAALVYFKQAPMYKTGLQSKMTT